MELDNGKSIRLEESGGVDEKEELNLKADLVVSEPSPTSAALVGGIGVAEDMEELEASLKNLLLVEEDDGRRRSSGDYNKNELISKLEVARVQSAEEERLARRAAWTAEARAEVLRRQQFRAENRAEVLPELVLKLILSKLDANDKGTMSWMNLLWRDLLKNERTAFLFPMIFKLLHEQRYFTRADMVNCRGVCKEWKTSLEDYLQNLLVCDPGSFLEDIGEQGPNPGVHLDYLGMRFHGDNRRITDFLDWTNDVYQLDPDSNHNNNPFISRKVRVGFPFPHSFMFAFLRAHYWDEVTGLLRPWGREVWELEITLDEDMDVKTIYDRLHQLLTLMPNVRYLAINGEKLANANDLESVIGIGIHCSPFSSDDDEVLNMQMRENPLPELPHLTSFVSRKIPIPIIAQILNRNGAVLENILLTETVGSPIRAIIGNSNIPNLKRFHILTTYPSLPEPTFGVEWPMLEKVTVMHTSVEPALIVGLFQCLSELGGVGGKLKVLNLCLHKMEGPITKLDERTLKMLSLELPQVEEFLLDVSRVNLKTIDFILPMRSLKKLTVGYEKYLTSSIGKKKKGSKVKVKGDQPQPGPSTSKDAMAEGEEEIIKFGNYTNRLYDSNIWKLLPELKEVTIGIITRLAVEADEPKDIKQKVYTREGYKQWCMDRPGGI